ncbi:MAG: cell wall-binding repeat-containing protein [Euzebya sp.]
MRHRLSLITALLLVVGSLLAGPAQAQTEVQPALLGTVSDNGHSTSSFQVNGCFADPQNDTTRGPDGPREVAPQADIVQFCVDYNPASLGLSMTVPGGTDPATDPVWDDFGAAVAYLYTAANGTTREIQLSTQRGDGAFEYFVLEGTSPATLVCSGQAVFSAGEYLASIPSDCVQGPDTIRLLATMGYDSSGGRDNALTDFAPGDGGFVAVPLNPPPGADRVTRLAGDNRITTAIATSQQSFGPGGAGAVLLADAGNFPDAVVGAPLAAARQAPVLLTPKDTIPQAVRDEITRALGGSGDVILLGGTAALSDAVRTTLEADGHTVSRIAGDSRFATSVAVAQAANPDPNVIFLAGGGEFADALLAGATAPSFRGVAVLVDSSGIPAVVQDYLAAHPDATTFVLGAVAVDVMPDADSRVAGSNPAITSAALLDLYPEGGEVAFATYENFPDGLSGGAYAASRLIPMVLSAKDGMDSTVLDGLQEHGPYSQITFFGGTAALSDTVAGQAAAFLG